MKRPVQSRAIAPHHRLSIHNGNWCLEGQPLKPGDLVEVRRADLDDAEVRDEHVGDDWVPAVVGGDCDVVAFEDPQLGPGSLHGQAAGLRTLSLSAAAIRRAKRPSTDDQTTPPEGPRLSTRAQIAQAESEGMVPPPKAAGRR